VRLQVLDPAGAVVAEAAAEAATTGSNDFSRSPVAAEAATAGSNDFSRSPGAATAASNDSTRYTAVLPVPGALPWEPGAPNLYRLQARLEGAGPPDELCDTFGFRTIRAEGGRLLLNGRPLYLRGALDQDYYPDLICTPPSEAYIEDQFRKALAMGLNCLRLHIKIADPRYYRAADRLGLLIWTELPNWLTLTPAAMRRARDTLEGMLARDWNHPSIIAWTLINESWGVDLTIPEHRAWLAESFDALKRLDPHRLAVGNSACHGNFQVISDIEDFHNYYAMPDRHDRWRDWVRRFAGRAHWSYAHSYAGYRAWRAFLRRTWASPARPAAPEVRRRGDEPLVVSEFGNWGLPDVDGLFEAAEGEPWWFDTGQDWGEGVAHPHGIGRRFEQYHLRRAFASLAELSAASQRLQAEALKFQIEEMRRQPALQGYVITELTDVHWEANGLLDMYRRPKAAALSLPELNADDALLPEWRRLAWWSGQRVRLRLHLSHYSGRSLAGSRLHWRLEGAGEPAPWGVLEGLSPPPFTAAPLGALAFEAPAVTRPLRARLVMELAGPDGAIASRSEQAIYLFPRGSGAPAPDAAHARLYAPALAGPLGRLGYRLAESLAEADAVVTPRLGDELRDYVLNGGRVLLLAERKADLQTFVPGLRLAARKGSIWEGNWASSLSWLNRDRMFADLPTGGLVDFAFAGLTPEVVIAGLRPNEYAANVHAALAVGWLHRPAALVAERVLGRGRLLISTFRLRAGLPGNPVAAVMLRDMVARLVGQAGDRD
jgi:hypothetical protein